MVHLLGSKKEVSDTFCEEIALRVLCMIGTGHLLLEHPLGSLGVAMANIRSPNLITRKRRYPTGNDRAVKRVRWIVVAHR